jgi:hypothetical protein
MNNIFNFFRCISCKEVYQSNHETETNLNLENVSKSKAMNYSKNIFESTTQTNHLPILNSNLDHEDLEIIEYPDKENLSDNETIFNKQEDIKEQTFIDELTGDVCVNNNIYMTLLKGKTCKYCEQIYKEAYRKGYLIKEKKCIYCNRNITQKAFDEIFKSKENSLNEDLIYEEYNNSSERSGRYRNNNQKKRNTNQSGNELVISKDFKQKLNKSNNIECDDIQQQNKRLLKLRTYNNQIPI